jgi:hypothetical protein
MIVRVSKGRYALVSSHSGRTLGTHRSVAAAKRQERAINLSKARAAGYAIPFRPARKSKTRRSR